MGQKISAMTAAGSLTGAELVEVSVPAGSPTAYSTKRTTAQDIADLADTASVSPIGTHMIPIMAVSMSPRQSGGCASLSYLSGASGQPDVPYLAFDSATTEYAEFAITMPESWNEGTVTFAPVWTHPATTTNFGVCWKLQGVAFSNDDALAANFGTAQASVDTGGTTSDLYVGPTSSAITIAGTPAAGDTVFFRIARVHDDAGDTMAVDAYLIGIRLYITTAAATDA